MASDRPKRRAARASAANISASHFVGYVEDEESVEMIMKKFEALEEYQRELSAKGGGAESSSATTDAGAGAGEAPSDAPAAAASEPALSEEQLEEIFKRTSNFTVKSALQPSASLYADDDDFVEALLNAQEGDEDFMAYVDDDFWDDLDDEDRPRKRGRLPGSTGRRDRAREAREATINRYRILQYQLLDRQGNAFTVKRRVRQVDPLVPTYVRIPPEPVPRAWAHEILPLSRFRPPAEAPVGSRLFHHDLRSMSDAFVKQLGNRFQAIYMDPPIRRSGEPASPNTISLEELAAMPIPKLIVRGMLFVWVDKEIMYDVLQLAEQWRFKCVENICWIRMQRNNRIVEEPGVLFNKTKLTLLMFRKDGEIELRHQRNPDCVYDFVKPRTPGELTPEKPSFIYEVIETLLPQAVYSKENPNGDGLLELWARPNSLGRQGWTSVIHKA